MEGILYSQDTAVIMTGEFVREQDVDKSKINRYLLFKLIMNFFSNIAVSFFLSPIHYEIIIQLAFLFKRMGLWFKPWFYKHVETFLQKVIPVLNIEQ